MFKLYVDNNKLILQERETVTSGSVNVCRAQFEFSADWEGLEKTAVFRCGDRVETVPLDASGECVIPKEVLKTPGCRLETGIRGTRGDDIVLPTVWTSLGTVLTGTSIPENARPPTPELWEQLLDQKGTGWAISNRVSRTCSLGTSC